MSSSIDTILKPNILSSLNENIPKLQCIVWKGSEEYDILELTVYPFDTIEHIKFSICEHYNNLPYFHPNYQFVGIPLGKWKTGNKPTNETRYIPADYYWLMESNKERIPIDLSNPRKSIHTPERRFITHDGSFPLELSLEVRGRGTIEHILLKDETILSDLHVYTLHNLMKEYSGGTRISEDVWNSRLASYFPNLNHQSLYYPGETDIQFSQLLFKLVKSRQGKLRRINTFLSEEIVDMNISLSGVKHMRFEISPKKYNSSRLENIFYKLSASETRPFVRFLPSHGSPNITKIHIKGVLPIPSLDDPSLILQWAKDKNPLPDHDFMYVKYLLKKGIEPVPSIYNTLRVFSDGSSDLIIQPPMNIRNLDPQYDFVYFNESLSQALIGIEPSLSYDLREMSVIYTLKLPLKIPRMNKNTLLKRLNLFQPLFYEIMPPKNQTTLISLRYKGVDFYFSENKYFSFLTQYYTNKNLEGEEPIEGIIDALQEEFEISSTHARNMFNTWFQKRDEMIFLESNEYGYENFNPGIDIHIFPQHPVYFIHANRVNSVETSNRIMTLISLLFLEDSSSLYKKEKDDSDLERRVGLQTEEYQRDSPHLESQSQTFVSSSAIGEISTTEGEDDIMALLTAQREDRNNAPISGSRENEKIPAIPSSKTDKEIRENRGIIIDPRNWFIDNLAKIDKDLFSYEPLTGNSTYSRLCQLTDDRQPVGLTEDEYQRMIEEYRPDEESGEIMFIEFPIRGTSNPVVPYHIKEVYTIMKYGSDPLKQNYYFCPYLFCIYDNIMIRPKDFNASVDRNGKKKQPESCPFCGGKAYNNKYKREPADGYTVIRRKSKKGTVESSIGPSTSHIRVGFHATTTHPYEFALPCCFLEKTGRRGIVEKDEEEMEDMTQEAEVKRDIVKLKHTELKLIRYQDEQFHRIRTILGETMDDTIQEKSFDIKKRKEEEYVKYEDALHSLHGEYILDFDKFPLKAGKFALLTPSLERYLSQDSTKLAERSVIRTSLLPNSEGFLRMGVGGSKTESVLSVIAPILNKNSIREVKDWILDHYTPKIFIHANFGNMVNEFFNPSDKEPTDNELRIWSHKFFHIQLNSENMIPLSRLYRSYERFVTFINDTNQTKSLRHIIPLITQKGLLSSRGILPIILDSDYYSPDSDIIASCPVYGVPPQFEDLDVVFISKYKNNESVKIYELLVYTSNREGKGEDIGKRDVVVRWKVEKRSTWPSIVVKRVNEFINQCTARHTSLFTSQSEVDSLAIPPLSYAIRVIGELNEGVIRDSYNHLVGLTFPSSDLKGGRLVAIPVIDDGSLLGLDGGLDYKIHLDWSDYSPASVGEIEKFYKRLLEKVDDKTFKGKMKLYPGLVPVCAIARLRTIEDKNKDCMRGDPIDGDSDVIAVRLGGGIFIPASSLNRGEQSKLRLGYVEEMEWEINQAISSPEKCGFVGRTFEMTGKQIDEVYQTFRLMVSNWLVGGEAGPEVRTKVESIIFSRELPDYEKRKRLDILFFSVFSKWFHSSKYENEKHIPHQGILRKDCRIITMEGACTGTCSWVENKCLLKLNEQTSIGNRQVSTHQLFIKRVIDELIRFPSKREEILKRKISSISKILSPIQMEEQLIIPENIPSPFSFLQLEWEKGIGETIDESKKFYEEMSSSPHEDTTHSIPDISKSKFKSFIEESSLSYWQVTDNNAFLFVLLHIIGLSPAEVGLRDKEYILTQRSIEIIAQKTKKHVFLIDNMEIKWASFPESGRAIVIGIEEGGIGFLVKERQNPYVFTKDLPDILKETMIHPPPVSGYGIPSTSPHPIYQTMKIQGIKKPTHPNTSIASMLASNEEKIIQTTQPSIPHSTLPIVTERIVSTPSFTPVPERILPSTQPSSVLNPTQQIKKVIKKSTPALSSLLPDTEETLLTQLSSLSLTPVPARVLPPTQQIKKVIKKSTPALSSLLPDTEETLQPESSTPSFTPVPDRILPPTQQIKKVLKKSTPIPPPLPNTPEL